MRIIPRLRALLAILAIAPAGLVAQSVPPLLPVEDFFRNSAYGSPQLSPDGTWLAAIVPTGDRRNIAVVDLASRSVKVVTGEKTKDVAGYSWANNSTLLFQLDDDGRPGTAIFAVERDGSDLRELVPALRTGSYVFRYVQPFSRIKGDDQHMLVISNERRAENPDIFRLNLRTGRKATVLRNPGNVTGWIADGNGEVRLGLTTENEGRRNGILWRASSRDEWKELASFGMNLVSRGWSPLGFDGDNKTLLISANDDADTSGVFAYDPVKGERTELILRHPKFDAPSSILYRESDNKPVAITYSGEKPEIEWLDDELARWQREVNRLNPDTINRPASADDRMRKVIWVHVSDRQPAKFSLLDLDKRTLEPLFESRPWIKPEQMAEVKPIWFTARDGREIPGYLTLPVGASGPVPTIIHPHGGPWARDEWGHNREVQFLANRGFAVLQVNFRGSTGYGHDHLMAGRRGFGKSMQDDLSDAVKWVIAQGVADPKRVGIYGASYGGYATMAGLVFTPELYAFGINYVGVVDVADNIEWWKETERENGFHLWSEYVGHPTRDKEALAAVSPVNHVQNIRAPLLVIHGARDTQVPLRQYEMLTAALKRNDISFESVLKMNEGHGFRKQENNFELYRKFDDFLRPFSDRLR